MFQTDVLQGLSDKERMAVYGLGAVGLGMGLYRHMKGKRVRFSGPKKGPYSSLEPPPVPGGDDDGDDITTPTDDEVKNGPTDSRLGRSSRSRVAIEQLRQPHGDETDVGDPGDEDLSSNNPKQRHRHSKTSRRSQRRSTHRRSQRRSSRRRSQRHTSYRRSRRATKRKTSHRQRYTSR